MSATPKPAVADTPTAGTRRSPLSQSDPDSVCREPKLVHFGLRQLFTSFSLAIVLIAVLARIDGVWAIVVASVALLIAAHVLGTFVGTRLRDTSADLQRWKGRPGSDDPDYPVATQPPVSLADLNLSPPPLASFERIGRWRNSFIAAGTTAGAVLGALAINLAAGDDVTWAGLAVGSISCAVIGTWVSLLGANFYAIARHTLQQANRELSQDRTGR